MRMSPFCRKLDIGSNCPLTNGFHSVFRSTLKYVLLIANVLIISDAIFLLINEKDSYQGEFIEGRHPVSKFLLIMLYLDIQSFIMILVGVLGVVGTKNKNHILLAIYALVMALVGVISYPDLDASFSELAIALVAFVYLLMIKERQARKYTEIIATIA